ncbi:MAG: 2-amino-4-hydroxy-6-hydroxymethyldihydropteridine diphosphokinase [Ignavibacteriaceae bacterium]|nr:2-amino-4-hydroxy-6-hydroxymethyldihydropteridine diphosphokinase [Ignavibacteriaceae bacterium]
MTNIAYLSLGSNINTEANLRAALELLAAQTRLVAVSSVWETRPVGLTEQPNFLNAAAIVETELTAEQLKREVLVAIEQRLGRVSQADKNAPRPIDLDITLFNREIVELGNRHIPDPEIVERPFVAIPLAEIAPDYKHPELGQTLSEIARNFEAKSEEMYLRPDVSQSLEQVKQNHHNGRL